MSPQSKSEPAVIRVSAPGRCGLFGGYSILEKGNASYSITLDARVHAEIKPAEKITFNASQFGIDSTATWKNQDLVLDHDVPSAVFMKHAVHAALAFLDFEKIKIKPFALTTKTDPVFLSGSGKSGLGSSAAATVAMVHAVLGFHGISDLHVTHHCAQVAHTRAQGKVGSGYDIAACVFGSQEYKRYSPELIEGFPSSARKPWDYFIRPLALPSFFHLAMAGFPKEGTSTVSMTKQVKAWSEKDPEKYRALMRELNEANVNAIAYLEELDGGKESDNLETFKTYFEKTWSLTSQLGHQSGAPIEPLNVKKAIASALENGAFVCKSPGAGGKDALVALCLNKKDQAQLQTHWAQSGLSVLDVPVDNQGVSTEKMT